MNNLHMREDWCKILAIALLTLMILLAVAGCAEKKAETTGKARVMVSILPQVEFVAAVGGERTDVAVMVSPGADTHTYEPKPSQIAALARTVMYAKVGSGIEFELAWMDKLTATNPRMLVVDGAQGIELMALAGDQEGEPGPRTTDPHVWLSPRNVQSMVRSIYQGLVQVDPGNRTYYEQNQNSYLQQLSQLDQDIRSSLAGVKNRRFIMYHPSLGYFARDFNLTMLSIEEEGKEPKAATMARVIAYARQYHIKVIFASPQFNPESARVIANAVGGRVVFFDDLAPNYIANLRALLRELVPALS